MDRIYAPWRCKYFEMPKEEGCLFCRIVEDDRDREVGLLYRGEHWFVILNMFPYTSGHVMVVANRHVERLVDISKIEGIELIELLAKCEAAIDEAYRPDALNTGANRGAGAGAGIVGHLHFHLVPRWDGDTNFMTALAGTRVVSEDLDETYRKLIPFFDK